MAHQPISSRTHLKLRTSGPTPPRRREGWDYGNDGSIDGGQSAGARSQFPAANSLGPILWGQSLGQSLGQFPVAKYPSSYHGSAAFCGISHHGSADRSNSTQQRRLTLAIAIASLLCSTARLEPRASTTGPRSCAATLATRRLGENWRWIIQPLLSVVMEPCPIDSIPLQQYLECTWESAAARRCTATPGRRFARAKSSVSVGPSARAPAARRYSRTSPRSSNTLLNGPMPVSALVVRCSRSALRPSGRVGSVAVVTSRSPRLPVPSLHISAHLFTCEEFLAASFVRLFVCGGSSATVCLRQFGRDAFSPEKVL
ncbi:hypothetical protein B0H17DRAFT_1144160 [Mycena rosella]|uniref:Uncharacterized protein n=1 Tax=Mycena rosella TaxID=1033263 RepID=A0AAD7CTP0_MYCRO|nr:hypothetical protein B0H17DRAFT_1144160 [Mycena rosella]